MFSSSVFLLTLYQKGLINKYLYSKTQKFV